MPFVIQCPHPACRKYMLLEDDTRGTIVPCMVCKKPLNVDEVLAPQRPPIREGPPRREVPPSREAHDVRICPQCSSRMRVAPTAARVRCPKCQTVF